MLLITGDYPIFILFPPTQTSITQLRIIEQPRLEGCQNIIWSNLSWKRQPRWDYLAPWWGYLAPRHIFCLRSSSQHIQWTGPQRDTLLHMDASLTSWSLNSMQAVSVQNSRLPSPQYTWMSFETTGSVPIQSAFLKFFSQINMFSELFISLQIKLSLLPDDSCYFCFH